MFGFIKNIFIGLFTSIVNVSNHTKYVSLSNQKCTTQPTLINLDPNEYTQRLRYHSFVVDLDRWIRSCNTLNDLCNKLCVVNKIEDFHLSIFNMITRINESKTLTKHISCECKRKFHCRKSNSNRKWSNDKMSRKIKNPKKIVWKRDYIWGPATCSCKSGKYLANIIDDSVLTFDETMEKTKTIVTKTVLTKSTLTNFYILLAFFVNYYSIIDSC